jgi:hypothetical protein
MLEVAELAYLKVASESLDNPEDRAAKDAGGRAEDPLGFGCLLCRSDATPSVRTYVLIS